MVDDILKFTKITFLLNFIVGILLSILYWMPEFSLPQFGLTYTPELGHLSMVIGALFLSLGIGTLYGYFAKEWKEIKLLVIIELIWLISGLIETLINFNVAPTNSVLFLVIGGVLLALFLLSFLQQEEKIKQLIK